MLYALLLLIALLLIGYFTGRWLLAEMREARGALGARVKVLTGGLTSETLVERVRSRLADAGLQSDCIIVPSEVTRFYDALRRRVLRRDADLALPGPVALALAFDVERALLWVRAVDAESPGAGREWTATEAFDAITAIALVDNPLPAAVTERSEGALRFDRAGEGQRPLFLVLDPAWGVTPADLRARVRGMVFEHRKPDGAPVLVR